MFIGEAPGRKGADRTRIPFSGDQSGANFDRFLNSIGLTRNEIFITSAALCNPRSESGANRKPSQTELANCSDFLRRTIEVVEPRVIVTLGDEPRLRPDVVARFITAPAGARAVYNGRPGHPVVLGPEHIERLMSLTGDRGARKQSESRGDGLPSRALGDALRVGHAAASFRARHSHHKGTIHRTRLGDRRPARRGSATVQQDRNLSR